VQQCNNIKIIKSLYKYIISNLNQKKTNIEIEIDIKIFHFYYKPCSRYTIVDNLTIITVGDIDQSRFQTFVFTAKTLISRVVGTVVQWSVFENILIHFQSVVQKQFTIFYLKPIVKNKHECYSCWSRWVMVTHSSIFIETVRKRHNVEFTMYQ